MTIVWGIWAAVAIAAEFFGFGGHVWESLLGAFVILESYALINPEPGDTLSEQVWSWNGGKPGRALMSGAFGLWLVWHFYLLTPGGVGPGLLSLALLVWLVPHFYTRGATG